MLPSKQCCKLGLSVQTVCLFEDMAGSDYNTSRGRGKALVGKCKHRVETRKQQGLPGCLLKSRKQKLFSLEKIWEANSQIENKIPNPCSPGVHTKMRLLKTTWPEKIQNLYLNDKLTNKQQILRYCKHISNVM